MADVPKTGMPYSELPEKEEFDENDEIFCLNEGYGERAKVSTFVDEVAGMGNADHMISDAFDEERDYTAGEYCIYDNSLYKFTEDKEAGEWDDNVVEITTVSGEIQSNTDLIKENTDLIDSRGTQYFSTVADAVAYVDALPLYTLVSSYFAGSLTETITNITGTGKGYIAKTQADSGTFDFFAVYTTGSNIFAGRYSGGTVTCNKITTTSVSV